MASCGHCRAHGFAADSFVVKINYKIRVVKPLTKKLSDLPTVDELGAAGLIDTSTIDQSIFGTGRFFKEQSINEKKNDIYKDIDDAIKKAPDEEK